ncbi:cytochrome P450 306a1-like [Zophobas morio]|uniref:cytochrome P450 306a1-like n=1 Tax=Zophobas morio TaxID=2755281 RepID=UPI003083BF1B
MILAALVILVSIIVLYIYYDNRNHLPGPWNLPIIGYLHKLDPVSPHLTLTKLAQKYGPIFRIRLGLVNIAVVSEAKLLNKILLKDETLGRPPLFIMDVMFRGKGLAYTPFSLWKDQRKFTTNFLKLVGATKFSPIRKELEDFITNYAEDFVDHVKTQGNHVTLDPSEALVHYISNVVGTLILGKSFSRDDENRKSLMHNLEIIMHGAQVGGTLNFLPFLRFLPKYRKTLTTFSDTVDKVRECLTVYIHEYEKPISNDFSATNLIEAFLLQRSKGGPPEIYNMDQLIYLLFDMFIAGTETALSSLKWVILYLAQYQDVQDKVRKEVVEVLHGKTLEMSDVAKLPYTQAVLTEVSRIRTIVPLGFPHFADEDVYVDDVKIDKGQMIMPLLWAVHMDPKVWDQPEEFRPERFLDDEKKFVSSELILPFQSGKRMCVGYDLAKMMIYLFVVVLVKNFKVGPCGSSPMDFSEVCGLSLVPKPQKVVFVKI